MAGGGGGVERERRWGGGAGKGRNSAVYWVSIFSPEI